RTVQKGFTQRSLRRVVVVVRTKWLALPTRGDAKNALENAESVSQEMPCQLKMSETRSRNYQQHTPKTSESSVRPRRWIGSIFRMLRCMDRLTTGPLKLGQPLSVHFHLVSRPPYKLRGAIRFWYLRRSAGRNCLDIRATSQLPVTSSGLVQKR